MNINNDLNNNAYTHNTMDKNDQTKVTKESVDIAYKGMEESFDLSSLKEQTASSYNSNEAKSILKNIDFNREVKSFSKESVLERFEQPLSGAQAHLSSDSVAKLLQD